MMSHTTRASSAGFGDKPLAIPSRRLVLLVLPHSAKSRDAVLPLRTTVVVDNHHGDNVARAFQIISRSIRISVVLAALCIRDRASSREAREVAKS
jgi:hypothetical protein